MTRDDHHRPNSRAVHEPYHQPYPHTDPDPFASYARDPPYAPLALSCEVDGRLHARGEHAGEWIRTDTWYEYDLNADTGDL